MITLEYANNHTLEEPIVLATEWHTPTMSQICGSYSSRDMIVNFKLFDKYFNGFGLGQLMQDFLPSLINGLEILFLIKKNEDEIDDEKIKEISIKKEDIITVLEVYQDYGYMNMYIKRNKKKLFIFTRSHFYQKEQKILY